MSVNYLLSVLDLYLMKEQNAKLTIQFNNLDNLIKIEFSYSSDMLNKTFVKISKESFFENLDYIVKKIKGNLTVQSEKLTNNDKLYTIIFDNDRRLLLVDFLLDDINNIRNKLNLDGELTFNIQDESYDSKLVTTKSSKLNFSMGFSGYFTLFLTSILFLDIFMVSLLVFKLFVK